MSTEDRKHSAILLEGEAAVREVVKSVATACKAHAAVERSEQSTELSSGAALTSSEEPDRCEVAARPSFDDVLARYQDQLYCYALHLTRHRVDADTLYQATMLTAYRRFDQLDGRANHRAWLYRIATNAFLRNRHQRNTEGALATESTETVTETTGAVGRGVPTLLREVEESVASLPLKQRLALIQRMYLDLPYAEIAANLRCSEAAARASVYQALRALRDHIGEPL